MSVQSSSCLRMMVGLRRSAAACSTATSSTAKKALSFLWKLIPALVSSRSMKEWPFEPISGMEGEAGSHAQDDGPQDCIPDVEIVMGEAAALVRQDAVVGVLGGKLRHADAKGTPQFHAPENEVDPQSVPVLPAAQGGHQVVFFADSLFGPLDGDVVVTGIGLDPAWVVVGAAAGNDFTQSPRQGQTMYTKREISEKPSQLYCRIFHSHG